MSTAIVDIGPLPINAKSVLIEYRKKGQRATWRLGETTKSISEWEISGGSVQVMATVRDESGKLHRPGRMVLWDTEEALAAVPLPKDVTTFPAPVVTQDGPVLSVTADVAPGLDPDDYEMEVRQSEDGDAAKDGLQLGFTRPGQPINAHAWPTSTGIQTLHARPVRIEDGRLGDWTAVDFDVPLPTLAPTTGHSNDFANGTLVATDGAIVPLEINGGDLRHKAIYAGDVDGATNYAGDFTDIYAGDARLYWSPAKYTTASVTVSPAEDLQFQVYPDLTSITRPTLYAGDCHWPAKLARLQTDGTYHDPRVFENSLQNGADETPTVMTSEVNIAAAGNVDIVPGRVHPAVASYTMTHTFKTFLAKRITVNNITCRHWVWCRGRPWHTHSDAMEMIHEATVAGSAVATIDITLAGDSYDELMLQVLWKNDNAAATTLYLRPNNDPAGNYDLDGVGANQVVIGTGTIEQNEWEDATIHFHNPAQGAARAISVEKNARWTATESDSPDTPTTTVWTNTADQITSIRVLTAGGATAHLAVGTVTRLWGKRHLVE